MNADGEATVARYGVPAEQLASVFPFHFALGRELELVQIGPTLQRICPDVQLGADFTQLFVSIRTEGDMSWDWILQHRSHFFLFEHLATQLQLRGEFVQLPETEVVLFLGSPWFTDTEQFVAFNLGFKDFAIHDPVIDMLHIIQANKLALSDAHRLTEKLTERGLELTRARDAAEKANQSKSDLLAMVSHEIRTPMNAVLGFTDLLLKTTELSATQKEYALTAASSGQMLLAVINDILDFSKIESGADLKIEASAMALAPLLERVQRLLQPRTENCTLQLEIDPDCPQQIIADEGRLAQILVNLTSNAIKFTDEGTIVLRVHCLESHADRVRLRFEIEDSGIGIAAEDLEQIFLPYNQVAGDSTNPRRGTGLGLAITKQIVNLMGGAIGASSQLEKGSLFWFELEFRLPTEHAELKPVVSQTVSPAAPGLRILVAEDNPVNQRLLEILLKQLGLSARYVSNGSEAVAATAREAFDLIFMDCQMPVMDGFAATAAIREREASCAAADTPRSHIVALTANAIKGSHEQCLTAGMDDFISKPFGLEQLRAALEKRLAVESQ